MAEIIVKSYRELMKAIRTANYDQKHWFRGQNNKDFGLLPGSYRKTILVSDYAGRLYKPQKTINFNSKGQHLYYPTDIYLRLFKDKMAKYGLDSQCSDNDLQALTIGQHYGLPTPLLDWSTDASVGLFFAVYNRKKGNDCALYVLNPLKLNYDTDVCQEKILTQKQMNSIISQHPLYPIAFKADKNSLRICRQSGNFTMHGQNFWPIDYLNCNNHYLTKIIIDSKLASDIQTNLEYMGINYDSIYVNKDHRDSICEEVKKDSEYVFKNKIDELTRIWENTPDVNRANEDN